MDIGDGIVESTSPIGEHVFSPSDAIFPKAKYLSGEGSLLRYRFILARGCWRL